MPRTKRLLSAIGLLCALRILRRAKIASSYFNFRYPQIFCWLWRSREDSNFTYQLKPSNLLYLCHCLSVVTGKPLSELEGYVAEVLDDEQLRSHVEARTLASDAKGVADQKAEFGRRIGWYALARALKPKVVVETGIDKGLGALILNHALLRNKAEGHPGRYFGTDINPEAGYLLGEGFGEQGKILYGDSISSLGALDETIDLFVNDSDHSADYEYREYQTVRDKFSSRAVILGDNAHVTDKLSLFAKETGRRFLFFKEEPQDHWYPGGGIGICF
jgi:hypothetical protein